MSMFLFKLPLNVVQFFRLRLAVEVLSAITVSHEGKNQIEIKKLGRQFETAQKNFNFSLHDPSNYTRARQARLTQFWLRIARLPFFDEENPITENDT